MFTSSFSEHEIIRYAGLTADFIKSQKEAYAPYGVPLPPDQLKPFRPYFNDFILKHTLFFQKKDGPLESPAFLEELNRKGVEFSIANLRAITFLDVVVYFGEFESRIVFHELVHVVQYQKLGYKQFANKYVRGLLKMGKYESIPLETNAYLLDENFVKDPFQTFSVEDEIQKWINANRF